MGMFSTQAIIMHFYYGMQVIYELLYTVGIFIITLLDWLMLAQARRKRLAAFLPWLAPSTIAASASSVACVIRFGTMVLHSQLSVLWILLEYFLGTVSTVLMLVSVARLWQIVSAFPEGTGGLSTASGSAYGSGEGTWPPPSTSSV